MCDSRNYFYFAYGSNMNPDRIRVRIPEARAIGRAHINGWRVVERLYADIERAKGGRVEGVLYVINGTELVRLDAYEGYPRVYTNTTVTAHLETWEGVEVGRVPAITYLMTPATRRERNGKPYPDDYRAICSLGASLWNLKNSFAKTPQRPLRRLFNLRRLISTDGE